MMIAGLVTQQVILVRQQVQILPMMPKRLLTTSNPVRISKVYRLV